LRLDADLAAEPLDVTARPHLVIDAERLAKLALGLFRPRDRACQRGPDLADGGLVDCRAAAFVDTIDCSPGMFVTSC
jgi:hypothetical protein